MIRTLSVAFAMAFGLLLTGGNLSAAEPAHLRQAKSAPAKHGKHTHHQTGHKHAHHAHHASL